MSDKVKHPVFWTVFLSIVSLAWVYPIVLVLINSFKQKAYISRNAFSLPTGKAFVGLENYIRGIERTNLISSFGWTVVVTVGAVLLIIVCTSMCAWWIVRTNNWAARLLYTLFLFNMIVPFQMVMFTLSKLADMMGLNTPWGPVDCVSRLRCGLSRVHLHWRGQGHPVRTRGVCDDRRRVGTENLLPNRTAYHAPEPDFSGDPADDVDLE